jgi:flagellar biosynthetic protein FliR
VTLADTLLSLSQPRLLAFLLALGRVGGLLLLSPILGSRIAPVRVRAALAFFLAVTMLPVLPAEAANDLARDGGVVRLCGAAALEITIGFGIGLVAQFFLAGAQMAGQLSGVQMGVGIANLIDPQTHEHITSLAQWQNLMALLVFLAIDGHHLLIRALAESFALLPIGGGFPAAEGLGRVLALAGGIFVIALKIAAPVLVLLLLVNGVMGVLSKLIPQMNVFIVGFPLNVAAGLFVLGASQPVTIRVVEAAVAEIPIALADIMRALY